MKRNIVIFLISHLVLLITCLFLYKRNVQLKCQLVKERAYSNTLIAENKTLKTIEQILVYTLQGKCNLKE